MGTFLADITIHHVDAGNRALLLTAAADVFDEVIDEARLTDLLACADQALFMAVSDGAVIGQIRAMIQYQPDAPPALYIDNLGVSERIKRHGVATALIEAVRGWGRANGCATLWVLTETDNAEGRALYGSLGLTEQTVSYFTTDL